MFGPLVPILAVFAAPPAIELNPRVDLDHRVMRDLHTHVDRALECAKTGAWNEAVAHSDLVLSIGSLGYKVRFEDGNERDRAKLEKAVEDAARMWEEVLDYQVDFVPDEDGPIQITFMNSVRRGGRDVGGSVQWRRDVVENSAGEFRCVLDAKVSIRTKKLDGRAMSADHLRHVAAHELGHVLGLGESAHVGDIMGPLDFARPAKRIGSDESEALRIVRERALAVRRASLVSALQELEGYNLPRASR